ncbi:3-hydroxyacyl-ACP dehydratase FabZ [Marinicella sp. W31]|uniref:3-hydroxyacyl-ACP dehydratase FabZ n=1 Tax=Marinicella sp. W31 TaxID=3023713 RepID=UPI00375770FD
MSHENSPIQVNIGIEEIMQLIPHRYPMLLVDRVLEYTPNESIVAIKNVTLNEPQFQGHFPNHPVMPGVMIVEAMAQASGILTQLSRDGQADDALFYLVKVDKAKFTQIVVPGDQLKMNCRILRQMRNMTLYACEATVDGKTVAKAEMLCAEKKK